MKKCIAYFKDSAEPNMSSLHIEDAETSMMMYITDDQKHLVKFIDEDKAEAREDKATPSQSLSLNTDELIALKKGGFTAAEIIELKQSKLI